MPRARKPPGTAVDRRNGQRADLATVPGGVGRFDPPANLCSDAVAAWDDFWTDRPALLLTASSKVVLIRWAEAVSRYLTTSRAADDEPIVEGSTGQPSMNPLYKVAEQARAVVEACERQLGIGGLNAANLGIAAVTERRSLRDLNASYGGGGGSDDQPAPTPDPRLRVIEG